MILKGWTLIYFFYWCALFYNSHSLISKHQGIVENCQIEYDNKVSKAIWRKDRKTICFKKNIDVAGVHGLCCDIDAVMKKDNGNDHLDVNTVAERCNKLLVDAAGSSGNLIKVSCKLVLEIRLKMKSSNLGLIMRVKI